MKGTTRAARPTATLAFVAMLAACSSGQPPQATQEPQDDTPAGAVATPAETAEPAEASASSSQDTHDGLEVPDTSSGPLTRRDFPKPRALGERWSYRVDAGDPEEGYSGNDTPVLERDPTEVAMLAVPFGCPRPVDLPVPEHALEVDYTAGDVPVIAVRASFGDPRTASRFFGTRTRLLDGCQGTVASQAEGVLVREVRRVSATALLNDRTPDSDPWTELAVHDGDQVVLVAVRSRLDEPPLSPRTLDDIVRAFRR